MIARVLTLALALLASSQAYSQDARNWTIKSLSGSVEVTGGPGRGPAAAGDAVEDGEVFRTGNDAEIQLKLGRQWVHLKPKSQIEIHGDPSSKAVVITQSAGNVGYDVNSDSQRVLVRTPLMTAAVRTGVFGVSTDVKLSTIAVRSGAVRVEDTAGRSRTDLEAGETARAAQGGRLTRRPINAKDEAGGAMTPIGAALGAAAAAAETAPVKSSAPPSADANPTKAASGAAAASGDAGLRGAAPADLPAISPTGSATALTEIAKQLPGNAPLDPPDPSKANAINLAKVVATAPGKAHIDAAGLAAIGAGVTGGKVKIDAGAGADAIAAMGSVAAGQIASAAEAPSNTVEEEPAHKGRTKKPVAGPDASKDKAEALDGTALPDPKAKKDKKKDPNAREENEVTTNDAPQPVAAPPITRTQAIFSGRLLPELLDLDDTGQFIAGFVTLILTLTLGAVLNMIMGDMGYGVLGNGALALLGTLVGAEVRDLIFSGDFWVEFDPYVSLAVILGFALGCLFGASYLRYRLMREPEVKAAKFVRSIPAGRLAKARVA